MRWVRSRGGYSTKLHVLTDGQGIPLSITATAGQRNEAPEFENVITNSLISIFRKDKRPDALAGDKGYSSGKIRQVHCQTQHSGCDSNAFQRNEKS